MADSKISGAPAASAATLATEIPANIGGTSEKVTLAQVIGLDNSVTGVSNVFSGTLSPTGGTDTYVTGSRVLIPNATGTGALKVGTLYRIRIQATKTAAGTVAPIFTIRYGTAGTTADTAIATATGSAQTAVIDLGVWTITVMFITVGSGTSATARALLELNHSAAVAAGMGGPPLQSAGVPAVGSGFNSTVASAGLGVSVNTGTSAVWTITAVTSEITNLT
jgi:hypothetical protein